VSTEFETRFRVTGELPPGDAVGARRAITPEGQEVAVKAVAPLDPAAFLHEVAAQGAIRHENLSAVYGSEHKGDYVYVATELTEGNDLGQLIADGVRLPSATVAEYGMLAARGLGALHVSGLVHGGVKPATLVRTVDGVKVTDAGIARAQGGRDLTAKDPSSAAWYTTPEEVMGRALTPASDTYALGAVLYRLATGELVFDGPDAFAAAQAHVERPVVPPREIDPAVSPAVEAVILTALRKAPEDRYADGDTMARALEKAAADGGAAAAPAAATYAKRRPLWPWIAGGVAVAIAAILLVLWGAGVFSSTPTVAQSATVPNVVGQTLANATTALGQAGFKLGTVAYQQGSAPQGTVLTQLPAAGTSAVKGEKVNLVVVGASVSAVPDLTGMTREQATTAITSAGFAVGVIVSAYSSTVTAGQVIDQVPGAGSSAPAGTRVAFTVSIGPQPAASPTPAAVPNVVGQSQATAVSTLQSAGFTAIVQQVTGVSGATGTVTAQSPSAGVLAVPGSSVTILVPLPPTSTPTPSGL
jgi:serine/threonine-protein kinase